MKAATVGTAHLFDAIAFVEDLPQRRLAEIFPEARPASACSPPRTARRRRGVPLSLRRRRPPRRRAQGARGAPRPPAATWPELAPTRCAKIFASSNDPASRRGRGGGPLRRSPDSRSRRGGGAHGRAERCHGDLRAPARPALRTDAGTGSRPRTPGHDGSAHAPAASLHRRGDRQPDRSARRCCICSTSRRPSGTTREWTGIYEDLRDEFDLADRYEALAVKSHGVQEALELVLDTARDRRLVLLEVAIVALIVFEIALGAAAHHLIPAAAYYQSVGL